MFKKFIGVNLLKFCVLILVFLYNTLLFGAETATAYVVLPAPLECSKCKLDINQDSEDLLILPCGHIIHAKHVSDTAAVFTRIVLKFCCPVSDCQKDALSPFVLRGDESESLIAKVQRESPSNGIIYLKFEGGRYTSLCLPQFIVTGCKQAACYNNLVYIKMVIRFKLLNADQYTELLHYVINSIGESEKIVDLVSTLINAGAKNVYRGKIVDINLCELAEKLKKLNFLAKLKERFPGV